MEDFFKTYDDNEAKAKEFLEKTTKDRQRLIRERKKILKAPSPEYVSEVYGDLTIPAKLPRAYNKFGGTGAGKISAMKSVLRGAPVEGQIPLAQGKNLSTLGATYKATGANLLSNAMKVLLGEEAADKLRFKTGNIIAGLKGGKVVDPYGFKFIGKDKRATEVSMPVVLSKNILVGPAKHITYDIPRTTGHPIPERLGGGFIPDYDRITVGVSPEIKYARPAFFEGVKGTYTKKLFDKIVAEDLESIVKRTGKEGYLHPSAINRVMREHLGTYATAADHPYQGLLHHYFGKYHTVVKGKKSGQSKYVPLIDELKRTIDPDYRETVLDRLEGNRARAAGVSSHIWDMPLFPSIVKPSGMLDRGVLSSIPTGAIMPFGVTTDITRDIQNVHPGIMIPEIINDPRIVKGLAGTRTWQPYVSTALSETLTEQTMALTGAPPNIYRNIGMVLSVEQGGKILPGSHLISERMTDALFSPELAEMLRIDVSGSLKDMDTRAMLKTGMSGVTPSSRQGSLFVEGMKLSGSTTLGLGRGQYEGIDLLMGGYDIARKYPHDYQKMYLGSTMERLSEFVSRNPQFRDREMHVIEKMHEIVNKNLDLDAITPGTGFLAWENSKEGKLLSESKIIRRATITGQQVPTMQIGPRSILGAKTVGAIEELFQSEFQGALKPGFDIKTITQGGVTLKLAQAVAAVAPREAHYGQSALRNMSRVGKSPFAEDLLRPDFDLTEAGYFAKDRGSRIAPNLLMQLEASPSQSASKLRGMLENVIIGQKNLPERMAKVRDFMAMLATIPSGESGVARATSITASSADELRFGSIKEFGKYLTDNKLKAIPKGITDPSDINKVIEGTYAAGDLYRKRVRIRLTEGLSLALETGKKAKTRVFGEIVLPSIMPLLEPAVHKFRKPGASLDLPPLYKALEAVYGTIAKGTNPAGITSAIQKLYQTQSAEGLKDLKTILSPKLSGSGYFGIHPGFDQRQLKLLTQLGISPGTPALGFGQAAMHPEDILAMGGKAALRAARKRDLYPLTSSFPLQGPGNVLPLQVIPSTSVERGGILMGVDTTLMGFRDHDFDRLGIVVNPFGSGSKEWKTFNSTLRQYHLDVKSLYAAAYKTPEWKDAVTQGESVLSRYKQMLDPKEFAIGQRNLFLNIKNQMAHMDAANLAQAYTQLSDDSTGLLHAFIEMRDKTAKNISNIQMDAKLATKAGTGQVSNTMKALNIASFEYSRAKIAEYAMENKITVEEAAQVFKVGRHGIKGNDFASKFARARINLSVFAGYVEQEAIQKGTVTQSVLLSSLSDLFEGKNKEQFRGVAEDFVKSTMTKFYDAKTKGGAPFVVAGAYPKTAEEILSSSKQVSKELALFMEEVSAFQSQSLGSFGRLPILYKALSSSVTNPGAVAMELAETLARTGGTGVTGPLERVFTELGLGDPFRVAEEVVVDEVAGKKGENIRLKLSKGKEKAAASVMSDKKDVRSIMETAKEHAHGIWNWFTAKPDGTKKLSHYAKRGGIAAAAGLVGLGLARNLFFPNFTPPERASSYIDMAPPDGSMGTPMDLGGSVNTGGSMPAVYASMDNGVGEARHPVHLGRGMRYNMANSIAPSPNGMASSPLPPTGNVDGYKYGGGSFGRDVPVTTSESYYDTRTVRYRPPSPRVSVARANNIDLIDYGEETAGQMYNIDYNRQGGSYSNGTYIPRHNLV